MVRRQMIFSGRRVMRGRGLGSIFAKIFRSSVPYLKNIGKYATRQLLQTGVETLNDMDGGMNVKEAFKSNLQKSKRRIITDIKSKMSGGGGGTLTRRRRRRAKKQTDKSRKRKRKTPKTKRNSKNKKRKVNNNNKSCLF